MSALSMKLRAEPPRRLDMSAFVPGRLAGLSIAEIERLEIAAGPKPIKAGDFFAFDGAPGDRLVIEGGSSRLDYIGKAHAGGEIIVEGDAGAYAGRQMKTGRMEIRGNAGVGLASNLKGGIIVVDGSAGGYLGAPKPGEKDGMAGGSVVVKGDAGECAGERMRRGTLVVKGRLGENAGARMMGGTIWAEKGLTRGAGIQMRRGTLIGPSLDAPLPTFLDCGQHDLLIVRMMQKYWAEILGDLAPPSLTAAPRRLMGDTASLGKGEILIAEAA